MTHRYHDEFIKLYIGQDTIECYKKTEFYKGLYNFFITKEKMDECVTDVVKHQCIDADKIDKILEQQHLLREKDLAAVLLCEMSDKVVKIYTFGGLMLYFTNRPTLRSKMSWDSRDFAKFKKTQPPLNISYDEAYITYIVLNTEEYFIEHNEKFTVEELDKLKAFTQQPLKAENG